jgi:hypothetical protein
MMAARTFLWIFGVCWLACSVDGAEPTGLSFRLSFDKQTLTADFAAGQQYTMLVYLYPIGDEAVFNHIHVGAGTATEAMWRAGAPAGAARPTPALVLNQAYALR